MSDLERYMDAAECGNVHEAVALAAEIIQRNLDEIERLMASAIDEEGK